MANKKPSEFKRYMEAYHQWYIATEDIPPRINGAEGNALKSLIVYFALLCDKDEELAFKSWKAMLEHWDKLPPFYQQQKDLKQINSNINAIIREIKNSRKKRTGVSDAYAEQVRRDIQS